MNVFLITLQVYMLNMSAHTNISVIIQNILLVEQTSDNLQFNHLLKEGLIMLVFCGCV